MVVVDDSVMSLCNKSNRGISRDSCEVKQVAARFNGRMESDCKETLLFVINGPKLQEESIGVLARLRDGFGVNPVVATRHC